MPVNSLCHRIGMRPFQMYKYLLSISLLTVTVATATGQQPFFKNYKVRDGLPSNNVYYVFQDSKGYLWFCTDLGVSRFDGAHFTNFTTADGMSDNEVFTCHEDRQGRLWFATLNGKPCFYQHGAMHSEHDTPLLRGFSLDGLVHNIFQEETGATVLASATRIGWLDFEKNTASVHSFPETAIRVWNEPGDTIGMLDDRHIGFFIDEKQVFVASIPAVSNPLKLNVSKDTLYMTDMHNLLVYNIKQRKIIKLFAFPKTMGEAIAVRAAGSRLWVGSRNGAFLFGRHGLYLRQVYLPGKQVSSIFEDREGSWWFSTLDDGVFYAPAPDIRQITTPQDEHPERVNCLSADANGKLWTGLTKNKFGTYENGELRLYDLFPKGLTLRSITSIRHLPDGTAVLAGKAGTLTVKNGKSRFLYMPSTDVNFDQQGNLWSALAGLYLIPAGKLDDYQFLQKQFNERDVVDFFKKHPAEKLTDLRVERVVFDDKNTVWLASPSGLFFYKNNELSEAVLPHNTRDLIIDHKTNILWALTESDGLFALRNGRALDSIPIVSAGQNNKICLGFCKDEKGSFWIATASGLCKVEGYPGHLRMLDYSNVNGLGAEKLNDVAVTDGHLFLGKDDGLVAVPLSIFSKKIPPPPVYIKGLAVNGKDTALPQLPELNAGENSLTFNFEGLSFKDYKNLSYRYRLLGKESAWHTTKNEAVEYASLRPGKYRFEVLAKNSSGAESLKPAVLDFLIAKPFYLEWWFMAISLAAIIGLVAAWVRRRERKMRQKYEYQRRLMSSENERLELQKKNVDLRMLALRLQMNPHFIFNALNTIKGYYGQEKFTQANSYIAKFARLLRLNLDYSDSFIPLANEIELLKIYMQLSQIRYPDKMDFTVEVAADIKPSVTLIPSMAVQPFVENAVIHGIVGKQAMGRLSVCFAKENGEITATVRDDGIGRSASAAMSKLRDPHKPLATPITSKRLQLLRKIKVPPAVEITDLYDGNGNAAGTEVLLRLPFEIRV